MKAFSRIGVRPAIATAGLVLAGNMSALAGGLSQDVARQAMCEEYFAFCVTQPVDADSCPEPPTGPFCIGLRMERDQICIERYEFCMNPDAVQPIGPGPGMECGEGEMECREPGVEPSDTYDGGTPVMSDPVPGDADADSGG